MEEKRTKTPRKSDQRANRSLLRRTIVLLVIFGVFLFIPLGYQLWNLQIVEHDAWQQKAADNQTRDVTVSADRGSIYDASGNTLAMSATVYNLILSPADVTNFINERAKNDKKFKDEEGNVIQSLVDAEIVKTRELIIEGLMDLLDLNEETLPAFAQLVEETMQAVPVTQHPTLEQVLESDLAAQGL